ncbi:MAG: tRNA (adenosine(37)-N6)-threonylcarbamoyltransferase complex transferase subunit TsaD [Desulfovibrio sp.]|jgi:N6-L-threonylcarbamoyladenine synthase|nr:tRNA (adenosine(37)-N6)-threonylcarbamoyltransferase complex transferase subunit TsaD [Desulfovibrio sp.]
MRCLGIETSCDETALAVVEDGRLLGDVMASQADLHDIFGGVVPELASREHLRLLGPLLDQLLARLGLVPADIDIVAVARGPGLLGSLLVGVAFAKAISIGTGIPMLGVDHLHGHLLATGLEHRLDFPALGLLASGGHTHIYRMETPWTMQVLGRTLDDAAGEAFDKVAKLLGLPYPGGAHLDALARNGVPDPTCFPRPYLDNDTLDFSFSGLKTAVASHIQEHGADWPRPATLDNAPEALRNCCASFNLAVVDTLCAKVARALARHPDISTVILAGGVAANSLLRQRMAELSPKVRLLVPSPPLCTDNGAMIAYAGWLLGREGFFHDPDMEAIPRGRRIPEDMRQAPLQANASVGDPFPADAPGPAADPAPETAT